MNIEVILEEERNKKDYTQELLSIILEKLFVLSNRNGFNFSFKNTNEYFSINIFYGNSYYEDSCLLAYDFELYEDSDFTHKTLSKIINDLDNYIERSKKYE